MDGLAGHFDRIHAHVAALEGCLEPPADGPVDAGQLLQQLHSSLEELYVAEEEVRTANDQLFELRTELEEQRALYEGLFLDAPIAYLLTDPAGVVRKANRAACKLLGLEARLLDGKPVSMFVAGEDRSAVRSRLNHATDPDPSNGWILRLVRRGGGTSSVGVTLAAVRDAYGRVTALRWMLRDVTAHRRAEETLLAALHHRKVILDATAEGICGVDLAGVITFANPAAGLMLGWRENELVGRELLGVLDVETAVGRHAPLNETLRRGRAEHGEWVDAHRRDGTVVPLEYFSRALVEAGHVSGAVVSFTDISDRKRLERELKHQADHDALTNLLNVRAFRRELSRELALTGRYRTPTAVMMVDVDDLKRINDDYGHLAGDEMLRAVALVLRGRLRKTDFAARLGGDEFGVMLPRAGVGAAMTVADEVLAALRAKGGGVVGESYRVSASIGVAVAHVGGLSVDDALRGADQAMYQAKADGGGRAVLLKSVRRRGGG